jgi:hypothetical protein
MLGIHIDSWGWHMPHVPAKTIKVGQVVTDANNPTMLYQITAINSSGWVDLERVYA